MFFQAYQAYNPLFNNYLFNIFLFNGSGIYSFLDKYGWTDLLYKQFYKRPFFNYIYLIGVCYGNH
jgi:hypothetical protein